MDFTKGNEMNQVLSKLIRNKLLYNLWAKVNKLALYGMNFGVASGYADYSGELHIIKTLKNNFKNIQEVVIFDIGANIGDYSKFIIKEYEDINYMLYMFEPSLKTFNQLNINIQNNKNISSYKIGLGDKEEKLKLYYDEDFQGDSSILKKDSHLCEDIEIDTIDNFCRNNSIKKIDFLKMDVQGYEYNILLGAKKMLDNENIKYIQFEFDEPNIENRIFFKDFWEILNEKYYIYHSLYNGLIKVEKYHCGLENFQCMNYLAILKSRSV